MPNANRNKGFGFERELVKKLNHAGLPAERCWGSNGETRGLAKDVDIVIGHNDFLLQAKRHKKLPNWLQRSPSVHATVFREDRGETYVTVDLSTFIELYKSYKAYCEQLEGNK